jgi:hypothetical protein
MISAAIADLVERLAPRQPRTLSHSGARVSANPESRLLTTGRIALADSGFPASAGARNDGVNWSRALLQPRRRRRYLNRDHRLLPMYTKPTRAASPLD